jgi:methionyl-tRNA formyltransferase
MRLLFAGTPQFAVPALTAAAAEHDVCGVLTAPDGKAGRGRTPRVPAVKQKAVELGLPVFQPENPDESFIAQVRAAGPELLVVAAYGVIFKKPFLDAFPRGAVNVHPSLLPRYRGPSPIPAAILAGDAETGVTIQRLALKMDTGDILAQAHCPLSGTETTGSLTGALSAMGADLLTAVLRDMERGTLHERAQREEEASYCRLVHKQDGRVDWRSGADYISRMIRAYDPWPGAFSSYKGQNLYFRRGYPHPEGVSGAESAPGSVLGVDKQHGILIHTNNGILCIQELQLEFKRSCPWRDFLNGHKDFIGSILGGD